MMVDKRTLDKELLLRFTCVRTCFHCGRAVNGVEQWYWEVDGAWRDEMSVRKKRK